MLESFLHISVSRINYIVYAHVQRYTQRWKATEGRRLPCNQVKEKKIQEIEGGTSSANDLQN